MKVGYWRAGLALALPVVLAAGSAAQTVLFEDGLIPQNLSTSQQGLDQGPAQAPLQPALEAGRAAAPGEEAAMDPFAALADRSLRLAVLTAPKAAETLKALGQAMLLDTGAKASGQGVPREADLSGTLRSIFDRGSAANPSAPDSLEPAAAIPTPHPRLPTGRYRLFPAAAVLMFPFAAVHAAEGLSPASKTWAYGSDIFVSAVVTIAAAVLAVAAARGILALATGAKRLLSAASPPRAAAPSRKWRLLRLAAAAALALKANSWFCPADPGLDRPLAVAATPFEQKHLMVDGLRIRYIDEGSGPVLLLIPGLTSRVEEYDAMTARLKRGFRVVSLDLPGSGYSEKPDRPYSLEFYEDTVLHFLDALKVKEAYLGGGSLGGNLALRLARRAPDRFPKIVAWAPASSWPPKPPVAGLAHGFGGYALFWPSISMQSGYWYSPDFPRRDAMLREQFAYYNEVMSPGFVRMYWDLVSEQMGSTLQDIAPDIRQPVLLVWGDQDNGGGMGEGVKRLHQLMPNSRLLVLPGARHSLAAERPLALTRATAAFLTP